jgi:hypothetical protein
MNYIQFYSFLRQLKNGGKPCVTGRTFSFRQIEAIKSEYRKQGRERDDYFKLCIETRLRK